MVTVLVTSRPTHDRGPFPHLGRAVERDRRQLSRERLQHRPEALAERNRLARLERAPYRDVTLYEAVRPARNGCFNAGSYCTSSASARGHAHGGAAGRHRVARRGPVVDGLDEPLAKLAVC